MLQRILKKRRPLTFLDPLSMTTTPTPIPNPPINPSIVAALPVGRQGVRRAVMLQHIRTGRIISAPSVAAFCRNARLGRNARFHFDNVLKGKRLEHRGWGLPATLNHQLQLKDVFGNTMEGSVSQLRRRFSSTSLRRFMAGRQVGAIAPADHDFSHALPSKTYRVKSYRFRDAHGSLIQGNQLKDVAARTGSGIGDLSMVARGLKPAVNGVTFVGAKTEPRSAFAAIT